MNIDSFYRQLAGTLAAAASGQRAEIVVREVAAFFGVQGHEVGLFQINPVSHMAVLRAPRSIGNAATVSLQSTASSLLVATVREKRGLVDNAFAGTRHLHMIERTLAEPEQRVPVQKIMSVPVVAEEEVRWVIQVTRKARVREEAGADFTSRDLDHLEAIAGAVGGLL